MFFFEGISQIVFKNIDDIRNTGQEINRLKLSQCQLYYWSLANPNAEVLKHVKKLMVKSRFSLGREYDIYLKCSRLFESFKNREDGRMPSLEHLDLQSRSFKEALRISDDPNDCLQTLTPPIMSLSKTISHRPKIDRVPRNWKRIKNLPTMKTFKDDVVIYTQGKISIQDNSGVISKDHTRSKRKRLAVLRKFEPPAKSMNDLPYSMCNKDEPRRKKPYPDEASLSIRLFGVNIWGQPSDPPVTHSQN